MKIQIRRVQMGDEAALAFVQTESWKAAFGNLLNKETLEKCTDIQRATAMYKKLLDERKGNGYILTLDGKAHCIAWWDHARDREMEDAAELICIHSLPANWRKGYGSMMMKRVLSDITAAGYSKVVLWVFTENERARRFYEANGFCAGDFIKPCLGITEICYSKLL